MVQARCYYWSPKTTKAGSSPAKPAKWASGKHKEDGKRPASHSGKREKGERSHLRQELQRLTEELQKYQEAAASCKGPLPQQPNRPWEFRADPVMELVSLTLLRVSALASPPFSTEEQVRLWTAVCKFRCALKPGPLVPGAMAATAAALLTEADNWENIRPAPRGSADGQPQEAFNIVPLILKASRVPKTHLQRCRVALLNAIGKF